MRIRAHIPGTRETRCISMSPNIEMTSKGYAHPGWVSRKGKDLRVFVRQHPEIPDAWEFWQEPHPDYCDICGNTIARETGCCRRGHMRPVEREDYAW